MYWKNEPLDLPQSNRAIGTSSGECPILEHLQTQDSLRIMCVQLLKYLAWIHVPNADFSIRTGSCQATLGKLTGSVDTHLVTGQRATKDVFGIDAQATQQIAACIPNKDFSIAGKADQIACCQMNEKKEVLEN